MPIDQLTARESAAIESRVAGTLADRGLTPGDRFVLCLPGSAVYLSVVVGALRAGFVPVPVDPRLTRSEVARILSDVKPSLIISETEDLDALTRGRAADLRALPQCRPMHLTSGTTGRPKGVWSGMLSEADAAIQVSEEQEFWGFNSSDRNLVISPLYHSAPLRFAIGTIVAGGTVIVMDRFDANDFVSAVHRERPTTMFCVPAHLQRLFSWLDQSAQSFDPSSFRLVAHAGAPCPDSVRLRAHSTFGLEAVWEFYGSTEGQFTACSALEWHRRPGTLGCPRPGRTMTVDESGLLWCCPPPHARFSYWNDPAKTAEAWRSSEYGPEFTVGDLGRIEDGYVYLDSRREDLIITGGVNVYPAEVESVLLAIDGVEDVAVFGRSDDTWGERVCLAYVGDIDEAVLCSVAKESLAPSKRPKEYVQMIELPRTATGKVRRSELRDASDGSTRQHGK